MLISREGAAWTAGRSDTASNLNGVCHGEPGYVAVGDNGTILTSADGTEWTLRKSGTRAHLDGVAFGGGRYVAVGDRGTILTSADGSGWTARVSGTPANLTGVAYGSGGFVAVGNGWTILTSSDGSAWTTAGKKPDPPGPGGLRGIVHGSSGYVAVGSAGTVWTSADGTNWDAAKSGTPDTLSSTAFCSGRYVATGRLDPPVRSLVSHRRVFVSRDGKKWSGMMSMAEETPFHGVACGGDGTVVVVGRKILQSDPLPEAR